MKAIRVSEFGDASVMKLQGMYFFEQDTFRFKAFHAVRLLDPVYRSYWC